MGEDRLERTIDLASKFVKKYRDHPSVEGVALFVSQAAGIVDKRSDIDLLFVLSDSVLAKIQKVWKFSSPIVGLWHEWEILDDKTLPNFENKFEQTSVDCLFATPQMIRNSVQTYKPSVFHSVFQDGKIIYDKHGTVTELSK